MAYACSADRDPAAAELESVCFSENFSPGLLRNASTRVEGDERSAVDQLAFWPFGSVSFR